MDLTENSNYFTQFPKNTYIIVYFIFRVQWNVKYYV